MTSVKVAVRVRPLSQRERDAKAEIVVSLTDKLVLTNNKIPEFGCEGDVAREATRTKEFSFNYIFWSVDQENPLFCSQEKVFQQFGTDIVSSAFDGYNACAFAYGQPGSGKTYTMIGTKENRGLIPRICEAIFLNMNDPSATYRTEISFMEIYNERVRDLLEPSEDRGREGLRVREHPKYGPYVEDLSHHIVEDLADVQELIKSGEMIRCTAATNMNDVSSRSHAIFTLNFAQARIINGMPYETQSKIRLVDLAGSENADATGTSGIRLKEGGNINRSLVTLGTVITLLAKASENESEKKLFIPYRDSKLTWLLKDSLGGNSRTFMIATISPADINYNETLRTLRYAVGAKKIINRPTKNEDSSVRLIRELKEEITRLKAMLGGGLDKVTEPRVKEMLQESEVRVKVLTEEWTEKWHETDIADHEMAVRKDGMGIMMNSAHPHLIGIDDDIFSTGITLYNLKIGVTTIGRTDAPVEQDIKLVGLDINKEHCTITFEDGLVQLIPKNGSMCTVNGTIVTVPTKLTQGAVILLGKTNMFRFNNPAEAVKMKQELKNNGISLSRNSSIGYGRSISEMYRSTDSLSSSNWERSEDYGDDIDKLNDQKKQIDMLERRFDKAQTERDASLSQLEREVHDIMVNLEEIKNQLHKKTLQTTLYDKSIKKLTEDYSKSKEQLKKELEQLNCELEATLKLLDDEILILDEKENDLVISQITLQGNVHSKIDNLIQSKLKHAKEIQEANLHLQILLDSFDNEKKNVKICSKVNDDVLNNLENEERKLRTDLELKIKVFNDDRDKAESRMSSEIAKIEEAWQDIREHEAQLKEQCSDHLTDKEKAKLLQKQTHINEAKELLLEEQQSVLNNHNKIRVQIQMDKQTLDEEVIKVEEELHSKNHNVLSSISSKLSEIEQDIFNKRAFILWKERDLQKEENELENLEGMMNISRESCQKQQNEIENQKQNKKDKRDKQEEQMKAKIAEIEERCALLDKELKEAVEKLRVDLLSANSHVHEAEGNEIKVATEKEITRLQELFDKKQADLLNLKRLAEEQQDKEFETLEIEILKLEEMQNQSRLQELFDKKQADLLNLKRLAEEQQDKEFETLEIEILKLEEMQNQSRIDQEVKRRLRDVRQNKPNKRRLYESFASLETDTSGEGTSPSSYTLSNVSGIGVNVTSFCLKNSGSDSFYEFEIQMLVGKDSWTVYRRYSKFREMHKELKRRIPEMRKVSFPPKKMFTKSEKVLEKRKKQLEIYLQNVLEVFIKTPWCPLHPLQNKDLNMKLLCDFEPFFKRGLFERSSGKPEQ